MAAAPADEFPNYPPVSWGPWAAHDLIHRDGRSWFEVVNRETLERVPLFCGGDPQFLSQLGIVLWPRAVSAGETIIRKGEVGAEMFLICRGEVEVIDAAGQVIAVLSDGYCSRSGIVFPRRGLRRSEPRHYAIYLV